MDSNRTIWNQQQQKLRKQLTQVENFNQAIELFYCQHAMIHTATMSNLGVWSFEDEIWQGIDERMIRFIPPKFDHSIAWIFWHLTRIEDITMNLFIAESNQLFLQEGWYEQLGVSYRDTGNAMSRDEVDDLSLHIDLTQLREYRIATGRRTRMVISQLHERDLMREVSPSQLQRALDEGSVVEASRGLLNYWGGLTCAGLLLMPPTRHSLVHLNEAMCIKVKALKLL
jgi:hypothetical protein